LVCPFGVVIAGTNLFPKANIHYSAKLIATLLDPSSKGEVDADKMELKNQMSAAGSGLIMGGGVSVEDEDTCP